MDLAAILCTGVRLVINNIASRIGHADTFSILFVSFCSSEEIQNYLWMKFQLICYYMFHIFLVLCRHIWIFLPYAGPWNWCWLHWANCHWSWQRCEGSRSILWIQSHWCHIWIQVSSRRKWCCNADNFLFLLFTSLS